MATDCIIMRRGSRQTITYYVWNRYNRNTVTTYRWNRYNVNTTTRYTWNRYNLKLEYTYKWNKYEINKKLNQTNRRTFYAASMSGIKTENTGYVYQSTNISDLAVEDLVFNDSYDIIDTGSYSFPPSPIRVFSSTSIGYRYDVAGFYTKLEYEDKGRQDGKRYYRLWVTLGSNTNFDGFFLIRCIRDGILPESGAGTVLAQYETILYEFIDNHDLIDIVSSNSQSAYPSSGEHTDGYYYEYIGQETQQSQGSAAGSVSSTSSSAYPTDGVQGNYWYVYTGTTTEYSQGSANGSVTSTNRSQYPDNGRSGSYWYVYSTSTISYSQGSYIDKVTSTNRNQYPDNSYSGNYWYVYQGTSQDTITSQASLNSILSE